MTRIAFLIAGLVLVAGAMAPGNAVAADGKKCIYLQGGIAPDVGPYPCNPKRAHMVEIDRRAIFPRDPLSPHSERTTFGAPWLESGLAGAFAAAGASDAPSVALEYQDWIQEVETP